MAGGGSSKSDDGKKKARIEIIPLIDVIFFLLATFVLFTLSLNKINSLPVQLPVASNAPLTKQEDTTVTLQVSEDGAYYWNKELITLSEVAPRLQQYKEKQGTLARVLIANDDKSKFGATVRVLDEVRKADIGQVSVETRIRPTGR
ncbi:MAG: biopolymer transporter ExbD [Opitutae bacterium]|nr:biopolymer transporter ExbD [Opitutae bacterium]